MKRIENHCVGCAAPGYPCLGDACENRRVAVYSCDKCGDDIGDEVYEAFGSDLCEDCLKKLFKKNLED